jgi:hypothetical protein
VGVKVSILTPEVELPDEIKVFDTTPIVEEVTEKIPPEKVVEEVEKKTKEKEEIPKAKELVKEKEDGNNKKE